MAAKKTTKKTNNKSSKSKATPTTSVSTKNLDTSAKSSSGNAKDPKKNSNVAKNEVSSSKQVKKDSTKSQVWWKEDNAKAVATVIAFLLIPAAIIVWIFASSQDQKLNSEPVAIVISKEKFALENPSSTTLVDESVKENLDNNESIGNNNSNTDVSGINNEADESTDVLVDLNLDENNAGEKVVAMGFLQSLKEKLINLTKPNVTDTEDSTNSDQSESENGSGETADNTQDETQSDSTPTDDTNVDNQGEDAEGSNSDNVDTSDNSQPDQDQVSNADLEVKDDSAIIGMINKLPNTSHSQEYVVQKGDTIYGISMKICGNDSYYISNMNKDYLKVGSTVKVICE